MSDAPKSLTHNQARESSTPNDAVEISTGNDIQEKPSTEEADPKIKCTTLYLQANIPTFTYRQYCRIGFTYSSLHTESLDGLQNPNWPLCTDPLLDLPPGLGSRVKSYCGGKGVVNMRLFRPIGHSFEK
jgi:hypothetical protein